LLDESITVYNSFDYIEISKINELQNKLAVYEKENKPVNDLYLQVKIAKNERKIFPVLKITRVKDNSNDSIKLQLWLCVHSIALSQTDNLLSSIIKEVLNGTPKKESLIRMVTLNGNGDLRGEFLQSCKIGHNQKIMEGEEKRIKRVFTIENDSKCNLDHSLYHAQFFHTDYQEPIINKDNSGYQDHESLRGACAGLCPAHDSPSANHDGKAAMISERSSDHNADFGQEQENFSRNNFTEGDEEDLNLNSMFVKQNIHNDYIKKMKEELPPSKIEIDIDLDEWAALMHLSNSHCTQLKLKITNNSPRPNREKYNVEDFPQKEESKLYYLHKKIPVTNNLHQFKQHYIENLHDNCNDIGEWRPISSLTPISISKRLYKFKWKNHNNTMFSSWKLSVLGLLDKIFLAPPIEILNKKEYFFYAR
jgi:hypothetical protein